MSATMGATVGGARRVLIAASDSGAGLAGMRVQAYELGSRVARRMVAAGHRVQVAIRADDEEFISDVRAGGGELIALPLGRAPVDRLLGFYGALGGAVKETDCVYSLNPKIPYGALGRCRTALTIHDFCYLDHPAEFDVVRRGYHWLNQKYLLPRVDTIFTVSRDAAIKLGQHFSGVAPARVVVASNGFTESFDPAWRATDQSDLFRKFKISGRYFVFLGKLSPRKNLSLIIRAAKQLLDNGIETRIVMAGPPGWRQGPDRALLAESGVERCFQEVGYLSNDDVSLLLRRSAGLLYPSRCEGFGIPVLEGIRMGIPVVVAKGTVCAENAGPFAYAVGADDVDAMADAMRALVFDPPPRPSEAEIARHLAAYDWESSANIVAARLRRMIEPERRPAQTEPALVS